MDGFASILNLNLKGICKLILLVTELMKRTVMGDSTQNAIEFTGSESRPPPHQKKSLLLCHNPLIHRNFKGYLAKGNLCTE